jgi:hypothetical protein
MFISIVWRRRMPRELGEEPLDEAAQPGDEGDHRRDRRDDEDDARIFRRDPLRDDAEGDGQNEEQYRRHVDAPVQTGLVDHGLVRLQDLGDIAHVRRSPLAAIEALTSRRGFPQIRTRESGAALGLPAGSTAVVQ